MNFTFNFISVVLISILAIIVYKYLETFWTYTIPKPYKWAEDLAKGKVSRKLKKLDRAYYDKIRFYSIWFQIDRIMQNNVAGDFAELGVHRGETAKLIYEINAKRKFHLFDTFKGFDEKDLKLENKQGGRYTTEEFSDTNIEIVKKYIKGDDTLVFHPGYFPDTAVGLENETFSFVHLDADLYLPTLEGLKFFYSRLSPEGVIIIHDYNHIWDGVKKAVDEFMPTISESLIELSDWKGSAMIIKNKQSIGK